MKDPNSCPAVLTPKSIAFLGGAGIISGLLRSLFLGFLLKHSAMKLRAFFLLFFLAFFALNSATAADLKVCKTCDFKTVTSAVNAAKAHDRILVQKGYYAESNIQIRKPLQLIGVGKPVIDAKNIGGIFQVETRHVV